MDAFKNIHDPLARLFYEGTRQKNLLLPRCSSGGKTHWYPRPVCPHCLQTRISLVPSPGCGVIYSLTRIPGKDGSMRTLAYVGLDEGVVMLSQIIDDDEAMIGQAVKVAFIPEQERDDASLSLPFFRTKKQQGSGK